MDPDQYGLPARFAQYPNTAFGVVLSTYSYAPIPPYTNPDQPPPPILPIRHWSDFVYLIWKKQCGTDPDGECMKNLHGIIRHNIINPITWPVAIQACGGADNMGSYPGRTFSMDSEEGQALAGTPHLYGIIFSLWQHRADWGTKSVHSVTVFGDDANRFGLFVVLKTDGNVPSWAPTPE